MKHNESGFTLIELVVVIVILGILAATALPKFIDLKGDAEKAAVEGVAAGVSSAFAVNYAGVMVHSSKGIAVTGTIPASSLNNYAGSVMMGGMPTNFTVTASADAECGGTYTAAGPVTVTNVSAGQAISVTVSTTAHTTNKTASATLICTG